jgi:menaquinol-cytochrome c reductase iron-sulfur subunit
MRMDDGPGLSAAPADRRGFLKRLLAVVIGTILGAIPLGAGLTVLLDPLWRKSATNAAIRVTTIEALPDDGVPRKFPVLATRMDAWNKFTQVPIGAVYLRRTRDGQVHALNVVCPHAGCFVDFAGSRGIFLCPCHNSTFTLEGRIFDRASPASRPMDSLVVEVRLGKEVWVHFQNFEAGRAEKIPVA